MIGNYTTSNADGSKVVSLGYPRGTYGRLLLSIRDREAGRTAVAHIDPSQIPRIIDYLQQAWAEHNRGGSEPPLQGSERRVKIWEKIHS